MELTVQQIQMSTCFIVPRLLRLVADGFVNGSIVFIRVADGDIACA